MFCGGQYYVKREGGFKDDENQHYNFEYMPVFIYCILCKMIGIVISISTCKMFKCVPSHRTNINNIYNNITIDNIPIDILIYKYLVG